MSTITDLSGFESGLEIAPSQKLAIVLEALEKAWASLSGKLPGGLPDVTLVVQRSKSRWGHYTLGCPWSVRGERTPEVMISGENLARGAVDVFGTLSHEAAHALNHRDGIRDADSNDRHNLKFKKRAEETFGLEISRMGWRGFTFTTVPGPAQERWSDEIALIDQALVLYAGTPVSAGYPVPPPTAPGRDRNLLSAKCSCGFSLRASRRVIEQAKPRCVKCGERFSV
jgi:hypothetical protein